MDQEGPFAPFALAPPPPPSATVQLTGAKESSKSTCIPYKIEYGTGIRECKGPQPCNGSLIEQGVLQFSTFWLDCPWGPRWVYRHWSCMTPTVFKNLHDKIGDNVEDLHGFSHLSSSDQAHVRQAFDAGTPTGISRLTAAEIKSLLGQAGLKKSGDKGMITDRCTGFFNAAGLSLEGTLDDLRDRIDGYAALGAKGMLPTPGEGSSTGAMQSETIVDSHQPDVKMEIGGSAAMMDVEVDEKKPQLNSDTEDEELEDKKPHLKSDSEEDENFGKPSKKRKRATKKAAKPRVKKEPIKKKINVKPLAPTPASSVQPTRRSRRTDPNSTRSKPTPTRLVPLPLPFLSPRSTPTRSSPPRWRMRSKTDSFPWVVSSRKQPTRSWRRTWLLKSKKIKAW
ncbi:hypothetical protein BDY24DRAFT_401629 [Mrakia frigida]|uniref:uncharacterized protein n=1 Tax=Mrakia frigida TaxID=29902 RepID=UPI003FCC18A9